MGLGPESLGEEGEAVRSPRRLQRPPLCGGSPQQRCWRSAAVREGPGLCFHYPTRPVEAPCRQHGLCGIYLFTRELSSEHGAEGIGSSGASPSILGRGPAHSSLGGLTPSKKAAGGNRLRVGCPLYRILFGIVVGPREESGCPLARGGAGLQTTWRLASGCCLHSGMCLGDPR